MRSLPSTPMDERARVGKNVSVQHKERIGAAIPPPRQFQRPPAQRQARGAASRALLHVVLDCLCHVKPMPSLRRAAQGRSRHAPIHARFAQTHVTRNGSHSQPVHLPQARGNKIVTALILVPLSDTNTRDQDGPPSIIDLTSPFADDSTPAFAYHARPQHWDQHRFVP